MAIQCYSGERKNNVIYKWFLLRFIRILSSPERILIEVALSHTPITPLNNLCRAQPPPPLKQNWGGFFLSGGERTVVEKTADIWRRYHWFPRHLAGKPVVASPNVRCFLRLSAVHMLPLWKTVQHNLEGALSTLVRMLASVRYAFSISHLTRTTVNGSVLWY